MKQLEDGQSKQFKLGDNKDILVIAERVDADTPFIYIKYKNYKLSLTDSEAGDLIEAIKKCLRILPSSK